MLKKGYVSEGQAKSERLNYARAEHLYKDLVEAGNTVTLQGVVRDKATGKALSRIQVSELATGKTTTVDETGHFVLSGLPAQRKYTLVALPLTGQPYLITSKVVETVEGKAPGPVELDLVRGIPFRVRVVDRATGKPIQGALNYFPVSPNDPFERGIMGYAAGGPTAGAFYESVPDGHTGEYYGAVLPGPGILCFTRADGKGGPKRGDVEPMMLLPGRQGRRRADPRSRLQDLAERGGPRRQRSQAAVRVPRPLAVRRGPRRQPREGRSRARL